MHAKNGPQQRHSIPTPDHGRELAKINYLLCQLPAEVIRELGLQLIREYPWLKTDLHF